MKDPKDTTKKIENLVLITDFSDLARTAYPAAASIASQYGATVHLAHETEPVPPLYFEHMSSDFPIRAYYDALASKLADEAAHESLQGVDVETHLLHEQDRPYPLIDFLGSENVDLVVLATHGHTGLSHVLLGSYAEKVARRSPVPTLTYRRREGPGQPFAIRSMLVPTDLSENADAALPMVRFFAERYDPKITVVSVLPELDEFVYGRFGTAISHEDLREQSEEAQERRKRKLAEAYAERLEGLQPSFEVRVGTPYREIVRCAAETKADLVVMATHGWTGLKHFFFGSIAEKVLRTAPCSVLTVRPQSIQESKE